MKKIKNFKKVFLILIFPISVLNAFSQDSEEIKEIRRNFYEINNNISKYDEAKINVYESTEGGEIIVYREEDEIKKIREEHFGEWGKVIIETYLLGGELSFIFKQNFEYNACIFWTEERIEDDIVYPKFDESKTMVKEDRFYFYNDKLLRWINYEKELISKSTPEFINYEKELVKAFNLLIEKIDK